MNESRISVSSIYALLLAATITVTCIVAFLIIPDRFWDESFHLSLIALIMAEIITFGYPIRLSSNRYDIQSPKFPFMFGFGTIIIFYDLAVVAVILLSTKLLFNVLLALHLLILLFLVVAAGIWKIAARTVANQ
jgi:hypothetical protein